MQKTKTDYTKVWNTVRYKIRKSIGHALPAVVTIVLALLVGSVLIMISGNDPIESYKQLFLGAFGNTHRISETLTKAVPLLLVALGTSVAFRSQIWNIGGNGQLIMGAIAAVAVGLYLPLPAFITMPVAFISAALAGAAYGGFAGWLRAKFNANEVITTLMLNYIAVYFLAYLVSGPMMDPAGFNFPQSRIIPDGLQLPLFIPGMRIHAGIFIAIIAAVIMYFFWRSTTGFRVKLVGASKNVAKYAGINVNSTIIFTMLVSGGLAGLAGFNEAFGVHYRIMDGIANDYGNLAIVVALLGNLRPIGVTVSSLFFAALMVGGSTMQRLAGVPYSVVNVLQGLIIIFVICREVIKIDSVKKLFIKKGGKK